MWPEFHFLLPYLKKDQKFLDLGCGNGRLSAFTKSTGIDYTGVDNSAELIKLAKKNYAGEKFQVADITNLPFDDNSFDFISSVAVFHHLPSTKERQKAFDEVARILKKDGYFFITVWNIFQPKYKKYIWENRMKKLRFASHLGWNDAFIPFGQEKVLRYVHGYKPAEIERYLSKHFRIKKHWWSKAGEETDSWTDAYNICYLARKK